MTRIRIANRRGRWGTAFLGAVVLTGAIAGSGLSGANGRSLSSGEVDSDEAVSSLYQGRFGGRTSDRGGSPRELGEIVRVWGDVTIGEGERAEEVVVVFGSAKVRGDVAGDAVVVFGEMELDGVVDGDLVVPFGSARLGPTAVVTGDLVVVGGRLRLEDGARVEGNRQEFPFPPLIGLRRWIADGLALGRPLPTSGGWWWVLALGCAGLYCVVSVLFARPVQSCVTALRSQPLGSFLLGLLASALLGLVLLLLTMTVVGIVVIPFLLIAALVVFILGKVTVYQYAGQQVGLQMGLTAFGLPLPGLILGIGMFYVLYAIPVLGFLVWFAVAPLALGAGLLGLFSAYRIESPESPVAKLPPPIDPQPPLVVPEQTAPPAVPPLLDEPPVIAGAGAGLSTSELISFPRAGFWVRLGASFVDLLLVGAVMALLDRSSWLLLGWVIYHVGMWAWRGTTIGGVVFSLKIVRRDGQPVDFPVAVVRFLGSILSALALFLGFFWAGWTVEKVAWHDLIAGTIVVRVPKGSALL